MKANWLHDINTVREKFWPLSNSPAIVLSHTHKKKHSGFVANDASLIDIVQAEKFDQPVLHTHTVGPGASHLNIQN